MTTDRKGVTDQKAYILTIEGKQNIRTMTKTTTPPPNGPSTTGKPSGGGRGNNPPAPKPK